MNNVLRKIEIDLYSPTSYEVIKAQQGDKNSRIIEFVLYDQGNPYEISDNVFFRFDGHRGDGSSFSKTEEQCITRNGNHISVTLLEDILYYAGTIEAKLVMYELGNTSNKSDESETDNKLQEKSERTVLSTIPFKISCIKNPCNENNLSNGELSIVTDLIFQMEEFSKNAQDVIDQAQESADKAKDSETNAKSSEDAAKISETNAANSASTATDKANDATNSANTASSKADEASNYAKQAQSYALGTGNVRPDESTNSAKYYYEQARDISSSFKGALRPMGTVTFANLPELANAGEGDMYNISDKFTTNANFKEGSGLAIPAGSNVYKTADGKWDILAGSPVTGVKGNKETNYRNGNITLTPDNIGAAPVDIVENGNFNDMIKSGFYTMRNPVSYKPPSSYPHFGLLVFCSNEEAGVNYVTQIAKDDNNIYIRKGHGYEYSLSGFEWEEWRKIGDSSGKDGYIAYPSDAYYNGSDTANATGYVKITLPVSWTNTFLKFTVSIYSHLTGESCEYHIAGYNYAGSGGWNSCMAVCVAKAGSTHANLPVRFGHNGTKCVIGIGDTTTLWHHPVAQVHDVMVGYHERFFETWESGWNVSLGTTAIATVNQTVTNTHVAYVATKATQDGNGNNIADTYLSKAGGTMTGSIITPQNDSMGIIPATSNYGQIGSSDKRFYRMYATTFYGDLSGNATSATKATKDGSGNVIADTYWNKSKDLIITKTLTLAQITLTGNYDGYTSGTITTLGDYKALFAVARASNASDVAWMSCALNGTTVSAGLKNTSSNSKTFAPDVTVVYLRTS